MMDKSNIENEEKKGSFAAKIQFQKDGRSSFQTWKNFFFFYKPISYLVISLFSQNYLVMKKICYDILAKFIGVPNFTN